jgi:hypothetical protein
MEQSGRRIGCIPVHKNEFLRSWSDLMPAPDAGVMRILFPTRPPPRRQPTGSTSSPSSWMRPAGMGGTVRRYHEPTSRRTRRLFRRRAGVAAGIDLVSSGTALIGIRFAESVRLRSRPHRRASHVAHTTLGLYGGWKVGNFAVNGAGRLRLATSHQTDRGRKPHHELHSEWNGTT